MKTRSLSAILATFAIAASLFYACSGSDKANDTLVVATLVGPITIDPRLAVDAESRKISELVCDGLMAPNERLEMAPNLATNYEMPSDTSYRFYLRDGVKFHDGTPLTADDVVYTYKSIIDGDLSSALGSSYEIVKDIVAESPNVVRFDLKKPYSPFLDALFIGIVSKAAAETKENSLGLVPTCTGPYKVVRFVPDVVVELEANREYYGRVPKVPNLKFQVIKDDNIRFLKLIRGDVDLVQNAISPILIEALLSRPGLKKVDADGTVTTYVGFNMNDPVLSNKKVRQAIAYAIDRDAILERKWQGTAAKANSILSPGIWAYDAELKQYPYDPAMAIKLLDESGFRDPDGDGPKKRFHIVYKTSQNRDRVDIARMIAHWLDKVGIGVTVEPYDWSTFFRDVRMGSFQMYTLSWVGVSDPNIYYDICNSSQLPPKGMNRIHYKNPDIDRLTLEGQTVFDLNKRKAIYLEIQKILFEELPYLPLWYEKNVAIYHDYLKNVTVRPDASYRTFVEIEKRK